MITETEKLLGRAVAKTFADLIDADMTQRELYEEFMGNYAELRGEKWPIWCPDRDLLILVKRAYEALNNLPTGSPLRINSAVQEAMAIFKNHIDENEMTND